MFSNLTTPVQVSDLFKSLEAKITSLKFHIYAAKYHRSTLAPIGRLPPEILAEIFYNLVCLCDDRKYGELRKPHYWLTVTFVCRAWRAIALSAPQVWSRILLRADDYHRITTFLQRSRSAPVALRQPNIHADLPMRVLEAVFGAMHRVQDFSFRLTPSIIEFSEKDDDRAFNAPQLRRLRVMSYLPLSKTSLPTLAHASWPVLASLSCNGATQNVLQAVLRPTLTNLEVICPLGQTTTINWVSILRELPSPETLTLKGAVLRLFIPIHAVAKPTTKVTLPRLCELRFTSDEKGTAYADLLNHLIIPADTKIWYCARASCEKEESEFILDALASKASGKDALGGPPSHALAITLDTCPPNGIHVNIYDNDLSIRHTTRNGREVPGLSTRRPQHVIVLGGMGDGSDALIQVFMSLYPLSHIRVISARLENIKTEATWQAFSQLPGIREISIASRQGAATFFSFMKQNPLAFPKLEWLVLSDIRQKKRHRSKHKQQKRAESLMPLLISLLEHRKEHGLGVKRLDIDFGTKIGPRDEFERDIGKLEALVEELEYRNETSEDKVRHLRWPFW